METQIIELYRIGKLEDAKKLVNDYPAKMEGSFCDACYGGDLEIAQWLLQVKPDIDISKWDELPFRFACVKGHLEVAKWLLKKKPDIDIYSGNEAVFRWVCYNGHLEQRVF